MWLYRRPLYIRFSWRQMVEGRVAPNSFLALLSPTGKTIPRATS